MNVRHTYTSLTRISDLRSKPYDISSIDRAEWKNADYVLVEITKPSSGELKLELPSGRMVEPMKGDLVIGALGARFATLEATGSWHETGNDGNMQLLTGAGLLGKMTSRSTFIPDLIDVKYIGHVIRSNRAINMKDFVPNIPLVPFKKPVVLMVGTSMSAGKTTAARIVTRQFKEAGYKVVGAKLTGAGRYRDILTVKDTGADDIFDFVDVGLPSSILPKEEFEPALQLLLSMIQGTDSDVAIVEIGASPLEPYNGDIAIQAIKDNIRCTILCASDPYAVYGVMKSFDIKPTIVSGIATNTSAGVELIEKLCEVPALNIIDPYQLPRLRSILSEHFKVKFNGRVDKAIVGKKMTIKDKWEVYKDKKGEWRWRVTTANGRIVGAATEGYKNKADCIRNAERFGYKTA